VTSITAQFYTVLKANPSHDATIVNVHFVAAVSAWARLIAAIVIAEVAKTTDEPQAISLHTTNMGGRIVKEWDSLRFVLEGESAPPRLSGMHSAERHSPYQEASYMSNSEEPAAPRVLLVDDDEAVRGMMVATLEHKGFEAVAAANVAEALRLITTEKFSALVTDLHMPNPGDGLTLITAMRHSQPDALTVLVSGYPDVQSAVSTILLQADEIMVKPFEIDRLAELVRERMLNRKPSVRSTKERVGAILQRCIPLIVEKWLARAKRSDDLNQLALSDEDRTGYLPHLVEDLVTRLNNSSAADQERDADFSISATAHGKLRFMQCYTPAMLVHESRILQVTLFGVLQENLSSLDFSLLLPDVMSIADEVDAQLTQAMVSYMNEMHKAAAA